MAVVGPPACCTSTMKFIFETYELYVCITDIRCVPIYVRYRFGNLHTARQHAIDQKTKALLTVAIFADPREIYGASDEIDSLVISFARSFTGET